MIKTIIAILMVTATFTVISGNAADKFISHLEKGRAAQQCVLDQIGNPKLKCN